MKTNKVMKAFNSNIDTLLKYYSPGGFWDCIFEDLPKVTREDCEKAIKMYCKIENLDYKTWYMIDTICREQVRDIMLFNKGREIYKLEHCYWINLYVANNRVDKDFVLTSGRYDLEQMSSHMSKKKFTKWWNDYIKTDWVLKRMRYIQWYWNCKHTMINK